MHVVLLPPLSIIALLWHLLLQWASCVICMFVERQWIKSPFNYTVHWIHILNVWTSSSAHSDPGKGQHVSGKARPTFPTPQEEAEGSRWAGALRVRRVCGLHWAETRSHAGIQHRHRRVKKLRRALLCRASSRYIWRFTEKSCCFLFTITFHICFFLKP